MQQHRSSIEHDATITALMSLHTAKRLLVVRLERRKRQGLPVEDIEVELAINRLEAKAMLAECF